MSRSAKFQVIFAVALGLAACGGSDSVNNAQPNPESTPQIGAAPSGDTPATPESGGQGGGAAAPSSARRAADSATVSSAATAGAVSPAAPIAQEVSVPAGTRLPLELLTSVSSETSTVEGRVRARLTRDIEIDGLTALPSGTILTGVITEAERAGRVKGLSRVAFRFTEADVRGTPERLRTNALVFVGEESTKGDAARIGGGAVAGAVIGGLLGGGKGAAQGAAIGGGAGTGVVLATRGKDVERAAGTSITATLAEPVTLQVPR
jgi:hypothetical protein